MKPLTMMMATLALAAGARPASAQAADSERTIPAARVPQAVRNAFRRAFPNAIVRRYSTEVENGKTIYEVESREGGMRRDLDISAEGQILEVETPVSAAQLPAAVRTAAERGGAHIQAAELVVAGHDTTYELRIQGRRGELKLRPNGQPAASH